MAVEAKRGCGYRTVGGIYLMGEGMLGHCDRLPMALDVCPVCSEGLKFTRNPREINAAKLFGDHVAEIKHTTETEEQDDFGLHVHSVTVTEKVPCPEAGCFVCRPVGEPPSYILGVGERVYTPEDFIKEAIAMGVSKRVAHLPRHLEAGKTIIYLSHKHAIAGEPKLNKKGEPRKTKEGEIIRSYTHGIFFAYRVTRIEKLFWESQNSAELLKDCEKQGIVPVFIPDGDRDHAPRSKAGEAAG